MKICRIGTAILCMLVLLSLPIIAKASTSSSDMESSDRKAFYFELDAGGDKDQTDLAVKNNTEGYAYMYFSCCNPYQVGYPVLLRLRSGTNNTSASDLYEVEKREIFAVYNDGYGLQGYPYYFRIQTDSNSSTSTIVEGTWIP